MKWRPRWWNSAVLYWMAKHRPAPRSGFEPGGVKPIQSEVNRPWNITAISRLIGEKSEKLQVRRCHCAGFTWLRVRRRMFKFGWISFEAQYSTFTEYLQSYTTATRMPQRNSDLFLLNLFSDRKNQFKMKNYHFFGEHSMMCISRFFREWVDKKTIVQNK